MSIHSNEIDTSAAWGENKFLIIRNPIHQNFSPYPRTLYTQKIRSNLLIVKSRRMLSLQRTKSFLSQPGGIWGKIVFCFSLPFFAAVSKLDTWFQNNRLTTRIIWWKVPMQDMVLKKDWTNYQLKEIVLQ